MPVRIGELTSDVVLEPTGPDDGLPSEPSGDAGELERQRRLRAQAERVALRTHARGLDD